MEPIRRPVTFFARDGAKLSGVVTLPAAANPATRFPAVLLCQGMCGRKDLVLPTVAQALAAAGFASLAFDYRGYGSSEGEKGWVRPADRTEDAFYAFAFLAQLPEVNPARLGVYGLSYGGPVALFIGAAEPRVRAVVAVSGPGCGERMLRERRTDAQWRDFLARVEADRAQRAATGKSAQVGIEEIVPFSPTFLAKYAALSAGEQSSAMAKGETSAPLRFWLASVGAMLDFHPEDAARRLYRPTLFINGEKDDVAEVGQVRELYDLVPGPKRLEIFPGLDHVDLDAGPGLLRQIKLAADWFTQHLAP